MNRLASTVALLVLAALWSHLVAGDRLSEDKTPAKPPVLTRQEALEQFRKLSARERLQRVEKTIKEDAFVSVGQRDLEVTITERGTLDDADAVDIICQVKAKSQGSSVSTSVISVIDDETLVKKGETLVTLDDSALKDQLRTQTTVVDEAKAARLAALVGLLLARKQNELEARTAEIALKVAERALKQGADKDADEKEILTLRVEQAKLSLEVAKLRGKAAETTAAARAKARTAIVAQEEARRQAILTEIQACIIKAPRAGRAIYYIPDQARWGVGSRQSVVAQGEAISEGQKLIRICPLKRFTITTRVHEALVHHVRSGQAVAVRVELFPDRVLHGHVTFVATVAAAPDFLSNDVRVYTVKIVLDQTAPGLRPGTTAAVRITTDKRPNVLVVPAVSVLGNGRRTVCFVKSEKGIEEREVQIGARNDFLVEIKEGLAKGELVLRDPRAAALLSMRLPTKDKVGVRGQTWPKPGSVLVRSVRLKPSPATPRQRIETYGLTYKDLERIAALPNVAAVAPVRRFSTSVNRLERVFRKGQLFATVPAYKDFADLRMASGRFLLDADNSRMLNVAVLGANAAEQLFPFEDPVGKTVRIDKFFYEVVGVLREQGAPTDALTAALVDNGVFIPLNTCKVRFGERVFLREAGSWSAEAVQLHEILVAARKPEQIPLLVESITTILEKAHPRKDWTIVRPSPQR